MLSFILLTSLLGAAQLAQTPTTPATPAPTETAPKEEMAMPVNAGKMTGSNAYIMVNPKNRSLDYKQAFDALRREKTATKVFFQLASGNVISNIIDMTVMDNGTVLLFRFNTAQGVKLQAVPVEEVQLLSYYP
jgi:hypothetical protein